MAMLLFSFSKSSGGARRALRTSAWAATLIAAALIALVFSGQAWGQSMAANLSEQNAIIPADADIAFKGGDIDSVTFARQIPTNAQLGELPDMTGNTDMDSDSNGFIDSGTDVVDWVLVQARVVEKTGDASVPPVQGAAGTPYCNSGACVTQAGLLKKNGMIVGVSGDGSLAEGGELVVFEELDFDANSQELYVAVYHRIHLPILSAQGTGEVDDEGVYTYDFTDSDHIVPDNASAIRDMATVSGCNSCPGTAGTSYAARGGDTDSNTNITAGDYGLITNALGAPQEPSLFYSKANADMNLGVGAADYGIITNGLGSGAVGVQFFQTN